MANTPQSMSEEELREINEADGEVRKILIKLINYVLKGEPSGETRLNPKQAEDALTQYSLTKQQEKHNELTDNEQKVWLYREDLEKRLLEARVDEWERFITFETGPNGRLATLKALDSQNKEESNE